MRSIFRKGNRGAEGHAGVSETASQQVCGGRVERARQNHGRPCRAGFTLIELLVVVAIIALLISILLPSLAVARQQARSVKCLSNLKRIALAGAFYVNENGVYAPFRLKTARGATYVNNYGRQKPRWQWFFDHGVGPIIDPKPYGNNPFGDSQTTTMTNKYFTCPELKDETYARDIRNGAYGYNYQYLGNSRDAGGETYENFPVKEMQIRHASQTVFVADSRGGTTPHGKHSYSLDPPRLAVEVGATKFGPSGTKPGEERGHSPAESRHRGKANVAFTDGHAEPMTMAQLGYHVSDGTNDSDNVEPNGPDANNGLWNGKAVDPLRNAAAGR